ncbi:hypothetical protein [Bradyrhizobium sp.]|uniref:hypothetical protein n=1 Tax=Bradyrhizobium sp. TaxID=376 RepID=UPI0040376550
MIPGGVTETIWHFIGHFQIIHDIARDRLDYDQSSFLRQPEDYTTPRPEYAFSANPDYLVSHGIPIAPLALFDEAFAGRIHQIRLRSPSQPEQEFDAHLGGLDPPLRSGGGGGGGGGSLDREVSITYQPGGQQTQLEINQYNLLSDNDVFVQGCGAAPAIDSNIAQLAEHAEAVLQEMADGANNVIPTEWWMTQSGEGVVEFLKTYDGEQDGTPSANSVEPGYYLNGELQAPAPEAPLPKLELYEKPDFGNGVGQWAEAGANTSFNAALIVDLTESGQTMIVMGDYFSTNAIFQTNSLIDHDDVQVAGGTVSEPSTGNNTTDNIADFVEHPGLYSTIPAHFGGWQWQVDVVNGDYYSIHTMTQTNLLLDNDVVVQTGSEAHYEAVAGANGQVNLAEVFNGDIHYDLIIVAGAYHGMNVIFQNNILLDNDEIQQVADGSDSSHAASSGDNQLINAATIERFGEDNFLPMNDDIMAIVAAIASGAASLDPSLTQILAGPDGVINVLYVTGDYYDVNAIWQTNVTSDIDVMLQLLEPSANPASANPDDPATQSVSTGGNKLINEAVIVDVAATDTYVNGDVYTDTILIQANLLPTGLDNTVNGDTQTLVTELVAFVDETQTEAPATQAAAGPPPDDPIANVLH